jgi:hypothetical protein
LEQQRRSRNAPHLNRNTVTILKHMLPKFGDSQARLARDARASNAVTQRALRTPFLAISFHRSPLSRHTRKEERSER